MAQVYDPNKGANQAAPSAPAGASPQQLTVGGGGVVSGAGSPTGPSNLPRFTNIQNYLRANTGANIGGQIQENIQGQAGQAQQQIGQAQQQFQQQAGQAYAPFQGGEEFVQKTLASPTTASDTDVSKFRQISQGKYSGPQDLTDYGTLKQNVSNIQDVANLGNTEAGRFAMLRNQFGAGTQYGQGQQTLDQLLLQQQPQNLQQIKRISTGAAQALEQARTGAQQQAQQYQQQAGIVGQQAAQGVQKSQQELQQGLQQKMAQVESDVNTKAQAVNSKFKAYSPLSDDDIKTLGIPADQLQQFKDYYNRSVEQGPNQRVVSVLQHGAAGEFMHTGDEAARFLAGEQGGASNPAVGAVTYAAPIDWTKYLSAQPSGPVTAAGVATPEQVMQAQALAKLSGTAPIVNQATPTSYDPTFDYSAAIQAANQYYNPGYATQVAGPTNQPAPKQEEGKVICTELHRQGYIPDALMDADRAYGNNMIAQEPDTYYGYFIWAQHVVKLMRKSKMFTAMVAPFGIAFAKKIGGEPTLLGDIVVGLGYQACRFIGKFIKRSECQAKL